MCRVKDRWRTREGFTNSCGIGCFCHRNRSRRRRDVVNEITAASSRVVLGLDARTAVVNLKMLIFPSSRVVLGRATPHVIARSTHDAFIDVQRMSRHRPHRLRIEGCRRFSPVIRGAAPHAARRAESVSRVATSGMGRRPRPQRRDARRRHRAKKRSKRYQKTIANTMPIRPIRQSG